MHPITPRPLKPGDTVAIIPTARSITEAELRHGINLLESWGLVSKLGAGVGRKSFQQAGSGKERAEDLQAAINDPEVRAIWCARGGYGTVQVLQQVDLSPLKNDPKWVVGFSDVTALHNALHNLGVASLHAQMPLAMEGKSEETRETLRKALFGEKYAVKTEPQRRRGAENRTGSCIAPIVGGNLSVLYSLRGTPYDIDPTGKILFLEDLDELLYHVDRMVQNLKAGGWFKDLAGVVVGGMTDMWDKNEKDPFGITAEEIILDSIGDACYPVCFDFPTGHGKDNQALRLGEIAKLSVDDHDVQLSFSKVV